MIFGFGTRSSVNSNEKDSEILIGRSNGVDVEQKTRRGNRLGSVNYNGAIGEGTARDLVREDRIGMEEQKYAPSQSTKSRGRPLGRWRNLERDPVMNVRKRLMETVRDTRREFRPRAAKLHKVLLYSSDEEDVQDYVPNRPRPLPTMAFDNEGLLKDNVIYEETNRGVMVFLKETPIEEEEDVETKDPFSGEDEAESHIVAQTDAKHEECYPEVSLECEVSMEIGKPEELKTETWLEPKEKEKKYFGCALCDYRGINVECLKFHVIGHIGNGKHPFACGHCDYSSHSAKKLALHSQMKHSPNSPLFFCNECSYVGSSPVLLHSHLMYHLGGRPYACTICWYRSSSPVALQTHISRHKSLMSGRTDGGRPDIGQRNKSWQKQDYPCQYCTFVTKYPGSLKLHTYRHNLERPFTCPVCSHRSLTSTMMQYHMRKSHPPHRLRTS